jgi:signal transduction histidine kinase/CheY-like chemotaxis protein
MTHILLIDDRRDDRLLAARELERVIEGLRITEIASAQELTRALAAADFDMVVTDYQLRWSDGTTVVRAVKARRPDCPVIMFSATATAEEAVAAMREGLDDYVSKSPRHFSRLALAAQAALERVRARRRIAALEAEQAEVLAREQAARKEAERARERLAFLVEAGALFSRSLEYTATLRQVATLAVPRLGDWCAVDILQPDGRLARMAVAHPDPAKIALVEELDRRFPPDPSAGGVWQAIRAAEPQLYPEIDDALLAAGARDPEQLALLRAIGIRSVIIVPLPARDRVLGALTLVMAESGRSYGREDLEIAVALARRAALAVENAQLYAAEQGARVAAERLADRIGRLQTVTASLAAAPRPVDVARAVADQCVEALGARASAVMVLDAADRSLQLLYQAGYGEAFQGWERFSIDQPYPFAEVVRDCLPLYLASRAEFNARYPELAAGPSVSESAAYLPLIVEGQAIGGMSIGFATTRVLDAEERAFLEALAAQCAQALDRARLYAAEQRARERLAFLAEASTLLVASLDYEVTLQQIARLCVPRLADWCVVDTPAEDGTLVMQIVTHVDPEKEQWARKMRERFTVHIDQPVGTSQVIRTGEPLLLAQITDELLQLVARDEEELRMLRLVGYRSMIVVPLRAHDRIVGALALVVTDESGRQYAQDDVALAEELARRAGVALDNARLYAEAQTAIQARDQFLAVAAHELKTPLTTLIGRSQLIARRLDQRPDADPRLAQSILVIASQGQRLNRLIANLLDVSRIQSSRLELHLAPLDLRSLVERVVSDFQVDVERQRIELTLPDAPLTVNGDALRLEQALANLLQNALKYSPPDATITIELRQEDATAVLAVQDRGIGIPETALPHLFTRFYRAPNVDHQHISGMGIGLFLVREIVTQHGGRVEVASAEQQGTRFTVYLPLAIDE